MIKAFLVLMLSGFVGAVHAQEPIQALYNPRPPYLVPDSNGGVSGLTGSVAGYAMAAAKVHFKWVEVPSERQVMMLKVNAARIAAVGWFKNSDREKFAKFSIPIYQDKGTVVLSRRDNARVAAAKTVDDLFQDKSLILLAKQGYSYGGFLDGKIAQKNPTSSSVVGENLKMINMIHGNHGDYMFIAPEEASGAIKAAGFPDEDFQLLRLADMPPGEKRYILYSKSVDDATIALIDKHIKEYLLKHP